MRSLYLALVPLGFFGMYVSSSMTVGGDAAATARNIMASEPLFRLGIVSALLVQIVNIFVVLALYQLLKPVNKNLALLIVIFLLLGVPIAMLNELNQFAVLVLLHSAGALAGSSAGQLMNRPRARNCSSFDKRITSTSLENLPSLQRFVCQRVYRFEGHT